METKKFELPKEGKSEFVIEAELKIQITFHGDYVWYSLSRMKNPSEEVLSLQVPRETSVSIAPGKKSFQVTFTRNDEPRWIFIPRYLFPELEEIMKKILKKDKVLRHVLPCVRLEKTGGINATVVFYNPQESGEPWFLTVPLPEFRKLLERGRVSTFGSFFKRVVLEAYGEGRAKNKQAKATS
jgi:hypothetical protein